ncbi:hypothetical protein AgCh_027798 [Apium graveolens]
MTSSNRKRKNNGSPRPLATIHRHNIIVLLEIAPPVSVVTGLKDKGETPKLPQIYITDDDGLTQVSSKRSLRMADQSHYAFIKGRSISDNVLFAQELFRVKLNGALQGYFPGRKGLRQGDPLSPSLHSRTPELRPLGIQFLIFKVGNELTSPYGLIPGGRAHVFLILT